MKHPPLPLQPFDLMAPPSRIRSSFRTPSSSHSRAVVADTAPVVAPPPTPPLSPPVSVSDHDIPPTHSRTPVSPTPIDVDIDDDDDAHHGVHILPPPPSSKSASPDSMQAIAQRNNSHCHALISSANVSRIKVAHEPSSAQPSAPLVETTTEHTNEALTNGVATVVAAPMHPPTYTSPSTQTRLAMGPPAISRSSIPSSDGQNATDDAQMGTVLDVEAAPTSLSAHHVQVQNFSSGSAKVLQSEKASTSLLYRHDQHAHAKIQKATGTELHSSHLKVINVMENATSAPIRAQTPSLETAEEVPQSPPPVVIDISGGKAIQFSPQPPQCTGADESETEFRFEAPSFLPLPSSFGAVHSGPSHTVHVSDTQAPCLSKTLPQNVNQVASNTSDVFNLPAKTATRPTGNGQQAEIPVLEAAAASSVPKVMSSPRPGVDDIIGVTQPSQTSPIVNSGLQENSPMSPQYSPPSSPDLSSRLPTHTQRPSDVHSPQSPQFPSPDELKCAEDCPATNKASHAEASKELIPHSEFPSLKLRIDSEGALSPEQSLHGPVPQTMTAGHSMLQGDNLQTQMNPSIECNIPTASDIEDPRKGLKESNPERNMKDGENCENEGQDAEAQDSANGEKCAHSHIAGTDEQNVNLDEIQIDQPSVPVKVSSSWAVDNIDSRKECQETYAYPLPNEDNSEGNQLPITENKPDSIHEVNEANLADAGKGTNQYSQRAKADITDPICLSDEDMPDEVDSEVEVVDESLVKEVVSENVKLALESLPLRNVSVIIPKFTRRHPPSADDLLVLRTMEEYFEMEGSRRRKAISLRSPKGCLLVLTSSPGRSRKLADLLQTRTEMRVGLFEHGKKGSRKVRRGDGFESLDIAMDSLDAVVTLDKTALVQASMQLVDLKRVYLIVIDSADHVWKRVHPTAQFMRDYYRALPEKTRPRVLAIARSSISPGQMAPIEHNLFSKFYSSNIEAKWSSCHGKGPRLPENELLDIEYISYRTGHVEGIHAGKEESTTAANLKDKKSMTALDLMVEEVGPLGVSMYRRRKAARCRWKKHNPGSSKRNAEEKFCLCDKNSLLGLSQKVMLLINELYDAYRASTDLDRLMAIVFAGKPAVAVALTEVISALPVFESLSVRVVIGREAKPGETHESSNGFQDVEWQGDETDDEEVSSFVAGETNVLIVSSSYIGDNYRKRPLPPSPLILRFDGVLPRVSAEAGGGRSRVVVFKKILPRKSSRKSAKDQGASGHEIEKTAGMKKSTSYLEEKRGTSGIPDTSPDEPIVVTANVAKVKGDVSNSPTAVKNDNETQSQLPPKVVKNGLSKEGDFFSQVPKVLRGPHENSGESFMYRLLLFKNKYEAPLNSLTGEVNIGIHNFLFITPKKLHGDDLVMSLRDTAIGFENGSSELTGYLKLDFQGSTSLSPKKLEKARMFSAAMFTHLYPGIGMEKRFCWDLQPGGSGKRTHLEERRCYLILPATDAEAISNSTQSNIAESQEAKPAAFFKSERERLFQTYFESVKENEIPAKPKAMEIDWKLMDIILDVQRPEAHREAYQISSVNDSDKLASLQGQLLFSSFSTEKSVLSGFLQHDLSPLSILTRDKKFQLTDKGTFIPHRDLAFVVGMKADGKSVRLQNKSSTDVIDVDQEDEQAVRWCNEAEELVYNKTPVGAKRPLPRARFNCARNVMKKRKTWVGRVCYTAEHYYNQHFKIPVQNLHQPLLSCARVKHASLKDLLNIIHGSSISEVCHSLVSRGVDARYVVPEQCSVYPIPLGMIFLPSLLNNLEQHLSACELREKFDKDVGVKGKIGELLKAVTASHVNPRRNYERLELLGDSVLKLSCTVRLFTTHPHYSEGDMHDLRAQLVSNARLHRLGKTKGIQHYLRFDTISDDMWTPPGTDVRGPKRNTTLKGLADVVESLCGAYFLFGAESLIPVERKNGSDDAGGNSSANNVDDVSMEIDSSSDEGEDINVVEEVIPFDNRGKSASKPGSSRSKSRNQGYKPLLAACVERGYIAGCKFLRSCGVFKKPEPGHKQILLSGIHAMHPKDSPAPKEVTLKAFPVDTRLTHPDKPWDEHLGTLEKTMRYQFKRRHLLLAALTHGSYIKSNGQESKETEGFQRLEFLGDAVADFCVVRYLFEKYPELGPGELTTLKSNVVSNESFARVSVTLGFHKFLYHGSSVVSSDIDLFINTVQQDLTEGGLGGQSNLKRNLGEIAAPKILGDIFEAIVGAIYVDSGLQAAWQVCMHLLRDVLRVNADPLRDDLHPCIDLAHHVRHVWKLSTSPPMYSIERKSITNIRKQTICCVRILGEKIATGRGTTLKRSKLMAAKAALNMLKDTNKESFGAKLLNILKEKSIRHQVAMRLET